VASIVYRCLGAIFRAGKFVKKAAAVESKAATAIVRRALAGTGIELVGSCPIAAYDARAPAPFRSAVLFPSARGLIVVASAGPGLWRHFRASPAGKDPLARQNHPYDAFVAALLGRADHALTEAGIGHLRFDAAFNAPLRVDFLALAELAGLGSPGPFGILIHGRHGPWWAMRGAWLVDVEVEPASGEHRPCQGCTAPCVGGWQAEREVIRATAEVRSRCIVGQESRYDEEQIAYHYGGESVSSG
jgi:hypothetical protein